MQELEQVDCLMHSNLDSESETNAKCIAEQDYGKLNLRGQLMSDIFQSIDIRVQSCNLTGVGYHQ